MKTPSPHGLNRRQFIDRGLRGAGLLVAGGAGVAARQLGAAPASQNPFAYDVERFTKTDPALVRYDEAARFPNVGPEPRRVAVGPGDRIYVAARSGVIVLDSAGSQLQQIPLSGPARCVAVATDGTLYAGLRDHLEVFDAKSNHLKSWDPPGGKTWFTGLAVNENEVFAADAGNRVILRYDRSGKLIGRLGEKNKERNVPGLIVPSPYLDVALAKDGLVRVNNPGRHCVETYTIGGDLELTWGKPSAGIAGFCGCCNPIGLAVFPDGRCLTCEKGLPRVKVFSVQGHFESVVAGPESFPDNAKAGSATDLSDGSRGGLDAAVDSQGRVWILDLVAANLRLMKPKTA